MQKKRFFLVATLMTTILLLIQIGLTTSVVFLNDDNNDVQFIEDSVLQKSGNYHDEIDILGIDFTGINLTLNLEADPIIDDGKHLYEINIYWGIDGNKINSTVISVGSLPGDSFADEITTNIVNASGDELSSYPMVDVNTTTIGSKKLSWNLFINDISNPEAPAVVNATATFRNITADGTVEYKDFASTQAVPGIFSTANLLPLLGTVLVCGFAGYTLGSIIVYFLTTNIKAKEKNAIFMGFATFALAIIVNWLFWVTPWQILWNSIIYLIVVVFGFLWANRGIMKLQFESPLPDGLPIETDEEMKAVIILSKGEGEYYNPLPLIRKYHMNKETGVAQSSYLLQPFEFYNIKRKYNQIIKQQDLSSEDIKENIGKNPYKKIIRNIKKKMEESIIAIDYYQEAYVDDWPTINQALLRTISLGAKEITILNLLCSDNFDAYLAEKEMKRIDFSKIGITIKQSDFLCQSKDIQNYIVKKITAALPENTPKENIGILLIANGQPEEWDDLYETTKEEESFMEDIKKLLIKEGFQEKLIESGWLNRNTSTIEEALNNLIESNCSRIIYVSTTSPVDCVDTIVDIPNRLGKIAGKKDIELIPVNSWNDDEEIVKIYLRLITNAQALPLESLGENAEIVLQSTKVGAKLSPPEEETSQTEEENKEED